MAENKTTSAAGSDAEVFLSASEDEAVQQEVTPELLSALVKQVCASSKGFCAPFRNFRPCGCARCHTTAALSA